MSDAVAEMALLGAVEYALVVASCRRQANPTDAASCLDGREASVDWQEESGC